MIYPVQLLVRQAVAASQTYSFILEDQLDLQAVMDPTFRFFNLEGTSIKFQVVYNIAQSAVFSDSYTLLDESVPLAGTVLYSFGQPIVKNSLTAHTLRFVNNDGVERTLYGLFTGWCDIKTVISGYVGTPVIP
jgi:hypothetical protein